jgi:hypothetical protein
MKTIEETMRRRILFILHRGLVDIRNLAGTAGCAQQIHDLADALEIIPKCIDRCTDEDIELVRFVVDDFQKKYPHGRFDYLSYLESDDPFDSW